MKEKILVREKPYSGIFYTMHELARQNRKSTNGHFKCCFFVSVIVGLKLNEKRFDFFSILCIVFFAVSGQFESSQKKKLLGYTMPVLRLIPNMTYFILGWSQ